MKNKLYLPLIIVAFLLCLVGLEGYGQAQKTNTAKQTWVYHVVFGQLDNSADDAEQMLNQNAAQGWEFVGKSGNQYYFKRAK
jgi:hypothetical protein